MKLYNASSRHFQNPDSGDGGIRRIVEAQTKYLPALGVELVDKESDADVVAVHAMDWADTRKPVVSHCHGLYWSDYNWTSGALDANKGVMEAIRKADIVTAPSKWVAQAIKRGMWIDAVPLYHGIDLDDWSPGTNLEYVLWNKNRVDQVCDPAPLNELASKCPRVTFVSTFGKEAPNVKITGRLPFSDMKELIRSAGIYLCTTRETFGVGTLEAMACGVPVVGWDWGGQSEFIRHKENGYLCRPGDFDALQDGLYWSLEHRASLSEAALATVATEFTWDKIMPLYAEVYQRALESRSKVKVSVVVPCYKLAHLLPQTVASIRRQSYNNWELIIVDDASPDNTEEVASALMAQDSRIRYVKHETNQYLAQALNTGISNARGEYIIPVDADNELGPDALAVLASALDQDRSIDIAYGAMQLKDGPVSGWPVEFDYKRQMAHFNQCPSTSMYRKKIWERVGGYRRRCRTAEDADFWCRATTFGRAKKVTGQVTLVYNDRPDSMSHVEKDWPWHQWYGSIQEAQPVRPTSNGSFSSYEPVKISVVIPVGPGHERLVVDALDSVANQTFEKWEAIVVNDSGVEIPWVHPFATIIDTGGKKGPAYARNRGFEAAKGTYVLPLDADDYLQPTALENLHKLLVDNGPDYYVYSDWVVQETKEIKQAPEFNCKDSLRQLTHAVTALYPKAAWLKIGGFDEQMEAWEDWDFVIALNAAGYCGLRCPKPLLQYRMGSGNRREELYAKRETLKQEILRKWGQYIEGGKQLMACGGCGRRVPIRREEVAASTVASQATGAVLIEYAGGNLGTVTYRGPSGQLYKFSAQPQHRVKYVLPQDVEHFLLFPDFRKASVPQTSKKEALLEAAGPPVR